MKNVTEFLTESNKIEGVYDEASVRQARKAWDYISTFDLLTRENILQTHRILMQGKLPEADLGTLRRVDRWKLEGKRTGTPWEKLPELMDQWVSEANKLPKDEEKIRQEHIAFEVLHGLVDGNGRMGRILLNWQRIKAGFDILVIKEKEKAQYMRWFK